MLPASLHDGMRLVQRLRLRVGDEEEATRARIAVEDGLATADFGDHGRLIFIRRLALPAFAGNFNGPAAARAIEAAFRAQLPRAVHATHAGAGAAPIVWFEDAIEAFIEALSLRAAGETLSAWFWPQVDAEIFATPAPAVARVFAALLRVDEGAGEARVLPLLAQRWRSWTPAVFARFIAALPEPAEPAAETLIYRVESAPRSWPQMAQAGARIAAAWAASPAKALWVARWELVAIGIMSSDAPPATQAPLIATAMEFSLSAHPVGAPARRERVVPAKPWTPEAAVPIPRREALARENNSPPQALRTYVRQIAALSPVKQRVAELEVADLALPPWLAGARASAHAGFFLLINAWHALGFGEWLGEQPPGLATRIVAVWLDRWSRRLGLADDDAQRQAWRPPVPEILPPDITAELDVWMTRTRRWLRTGARIGPASLVRRGGFACVTRTHIDVAFPLDEVDLRVRRCGLDSNPGWVPWLGHIVNFHFIEELHGNRAR